MALHSKEQRRSRRIPMQCKVKIKTLDAHEVFYGLSRDLSVDGISFETEYVPRFGEVLEIHLAPPPGSRTPPLRALMQVRRCTQLEAGQRYEVAGPIRVLKDHEHAAAISRARPHRSAA